MDNQVQVSRFKPQHFESFVQLNYQWIETYFTVEKMDREQLENPKEKILDIGGEIFFVLEGNQVVGTCAMVPHGEKGFELAKMAVHPSSRGKGYGDLLMIAAIDWAKEHKVKQITILSNTILEPAIKLYKKHGFEVVHLGPHPDYARCNIEMILNISI